MSVHRRTAARAATVAMAVLAGASLAACNTTAPSATPSVAVLSSLGPSVAPSSPVVTSSPSATPVVISGWQRVADQDSITGAQLQHVVWTGTRFVATATDLAGHGAFLSSTDGQTWDRQTATPASGMPSALATGSKGVVAVGAVGDRPAVWASADGLTWTFKADAFRRPAGEQTHGKATIKVTDVVATDTGWLAVGREDPVCMLDCGLTPVRSVVWTSVDGLVWTPGAPQAGLEGGAMNAVTRLGSGFVAVGTGSAGAAVWTSTDGRHWSRLADRRMFHPAGSSALGLEMHDVAVSDGIVVALGNQFGDPSAVRAWWSPNGREWSNGTGEGFLNGQVFSVASTPVGFIAAGPSSVDSCLGGIWGSANGHAWRCVAVDPSFAGFAPYDAAASPTVVVAVGLGQSAIEATNGLPGAVWWESIP